MLARATTGSSLLYLALASCALPELAEHVTPGPGWPDLAEPPVGDHDGRDDAALIIALDDPGRGGRPGAYEVASGWYRYLVRTRGLRPRRVELLRNEQASARAIEAAVERLEERGGEGAVLWLIYIGSAVSPGSGGDGALRGGDGEYAAFAPIRSALRRGLHESAFMLIDGCSDELGAGQIAGLQASPSAEAARAEPRAEPERPRTYYVKGPSSFADGVRARVEAELRARASSERNVFVLTAGLGAECGASLGDEPWPALAYAALGGLQGWADIDEDGEVGAVELATYAQSVLADLDDGGSQGEGATRPRVSAAGVDLILADVSERWQGPAKPGAVARLAPERLSQTADALAQAKTVIDLDDADMVPVPAGSFWMGCRLEEVRRRRSRQQDRCEGDERPARWTTLRGFAIDRHEVRWADYRACIEAQDCAPLRLDRCWVWTGDRFSLGAELRAELFADDHPVMCVDWIEAQTYCESVGKRLPTEAEWERAARGRDGRTYPWGEDDPSCALVAMHGCARFSEPVGSHPAGASPVGAQDMSGNVSEWVFDWWSERSYLGVDHVDPLGPTEGEVRVVRGGSFYESDFNLRGGYRYGLDPWARLSTVGFRCVR